MMCEVRRRLRGYVIVGLVMLLPTTGRLNAPEQDHSNAAHATEPNHAVNRATEEAPPVAARGEQVDNPNWSDPHCSDPKSYDEANLCVQRRAAIAAENAVWVAKIQTWLGVIGAVLVISTLYYARRQASEARRSAEAALAQIALSHPPKLTVRNIVVMQPGKRFQAIQEPGLWHDMAFQGRFYIANVGGHDGTITESHCIFYWGDPILPMDRPYEGDNGNNPATPGTRVPVGSSVIAIINHLVSFDRDTVNAINEGRTALWVMGWIEYNGPPEVTRRTAFCRKYDPSTRRFRPVADPDYEPQ